MGSVLSPRSLCSAALCPNGESTRSLPVCTLEAARRVDDLGRDRAQLTAPDGADPPRPGPHGFGTPCQPISRRRTARRRPHTRFRRVSTPPPGTAARAARDRERASARRVFLTWGISRGSRRKRPRRFWRRWRRNQYFPKLPDAEDTNVLLVETSAPLRFPNSYSTSCELQGRRSVRYK